MGSYKIYKNFNLSMRYLQCFLFTFLLLFVSNTPAQADVYINAPGANYSDQSNWDTYSWWGGSTRYTRTAGDKAEFSTTLTPTGYYQVWHRIQCFNGSDTSADYTIYHADGSDSQTVNQRSQCGDWKYLGNYCFDSSAQAKLVITTGPTIGSGNYTLADEAWFGLTSAESCTVVTTHNITSSAGANGSITPNGVVSVVENGNQTYTISPDIGYIITDVLVDGVSEGAVSAYTFTNVTADHTISASFTSEIWTITATAETGGSISPSGDVSVNGNQDQTFIITPDAGFAVSDIFVDETSVIDTLDNDKSYTFENVLEDHSIRVVFVDGYEIAVSANAGGQVLPDGGNLGLVKVAPGADQPFTIVADSCFEIDDVVVDGSTVGTVSSYDFENISANHTLDVTFAESTGTLELVATAGAHTTISPAGVTTVNCGTEEQVFTVTYDSNLQDLYLVVNGQYIQVLDNGVQQSATDIAFDAGGAYEFTYTLRDITENYRISLSEIFNISNFPLDIQTRPAPPNIMFVYDDSGSMDWEFMTTETNGVFSGESYIFDDPGDNFYSSWEYYGGILSDYQRTMWKSQWSGYNKMFYDPEINYEPWPEQTADDVTSASRSPNVHSHPLHNDTLGLDDNFVDIGLLDIPNAHYYVSDGTDTYLVIIDYDNKELEHYEVTGTTGTGPTQRVTALSLDDTPPTYALSGRSYDEEIQNFANWYTFHRKRARAATNAVATVIDSVTNTYVGIRSINSSPGVRQELAPIQVLYLDADNEYVYVDNTDDVLDALYASEPSNGGTPLRRGLESVGKYFDRTTTLSDNGGLTGNPWFAEELGGECQQSFAIAMTDGFWNGSDPSVNNADGGKGEPYEDSYSDTLADVSMYYFSKDLVPDGVLGDLVPGENSFQHLKTYGVAFGVDGSLTEDDYTLVPGCVGLSCNYPVWHNPDDSDAYKIDDLFHAAVNGRGMYLNASDPTELVDGLLDAIKDITAANGSAASASVNGDELFVSSDTEEIFLYQSQYHSPEWYGTVYSYELDIAANGTVNATIEWDAGALLNTALSNGDDVSSRLIATLKNDPASPTTTPVGAVFKSIGDLSATQQAYFDDDNAATSRQDLMDYIRGSNAKENSTTYRERAGRLGDIVHSSALFLDNYLYVGANDGMMHALDAITGEVKFSYVPNLVMENLKYLAELDYGDSHLFYVDNSPYALKMFSTTEDPDNTTFGKSKTYLAGGLGKGGKGYFSLDITDPESITDGSDTENEAELISRVLWEYPQADTPDTDDTDDMGYSFSRAYIVDSNASSITSGDTLLDNYLKGHVVVFGNGYGSANGNAVLYFINAHTGELVKKIDVGGGPGNGLSTPVVADVNNDYKMDYLYAGDLMGNLWKFDITSEDPDDWQVAFCSGGTQAGNLNSCHTDSISETNIPQPLFKTRANQPITSRPDVTRHFSKQGYMVVFGTGRFLDELDWQDTTTQSFYGIWDAGDDGDDGEYPGTFNADGTLSNSPVDKTWALVEQTVLFEGDVTLNEEDEALDDYVRVISQNSADWEVRPDVNTIPDPDPNDDPTANVGWFFDLPLSGERVTTNAMIRDGKAVLVSFILDDDRCSGGAESFVHELDVYTGGRLDGPAFDIDDDGNIGAGDRLARGTGGTGGIDNEGDVGEDDYFPPSAVKRPGRLESPAIVQKDEKTEVKIFSSSDGSLQSVTEEIEQRGLYYWRQN